MQRLDLMLENSPLESWWLSTNNPNQPSLTPLHKELNFIPSRYICFGKVSVKLNVVQVCCWRWIFWHNPSWHAAKLPVQPRHSCWAWIISVLLQLRAGTIPKQKWEAPESSWAMPCPACMAKLMAKLPACGWLFAGMLLQPCQHPLSVICHLPASALSSLLAQHQAGWAGSRQWKGFVAAVPPPKSKNCVPDVLQSGVDRQTTVEIEERHRTLLRLASDVCSRLAEPCLAGGKSWVASSQRCALYIQAKKQFWS